MKKLSFYFLVSLLINFAFGKEHIWQWHRVDCSYKQNIEFFLWILYSSFVMCIHNQNLAKSFTKLDSLKA